MKFSFPFCCCNLYGRGLWRIGAGLPQLERTGGGGFAGGQTGVNAGPYRGCPRVFDDFFFTSEAKSPPVRLWPD